MWDQNNQGADGKGRSGSGIFSRGHRIWTDGSGVVDVSIARSVCSKSLLMTADIITSDTADRVYQSALSKSNPKSPNPARIYSKLMRIQSEATYFGAI